MKKRLALLLALMLVFVSINVGELTVVAKEPVSEVTADIVHIELNDMQCEVPAVRSGTADYAGATEAMLTGFNNWDTQINIQEYNIPKSEFANFYWGVLRQNPQLFYVASACSYYPYGDYVSSILPTYNSNYTKDDIAKYEARVAAILKIIPDGLSEYEKALALHDYIVTHCEYDGTYSRYDAYNVLVEGIAVCQGYTLAYTDLLNRVGIENMYVKSDTMNHAWNLVKIDGAWYHVDATWNDPYDSDYVTPRLGYVRHTNFLRSDTGITATGHSDWVVSQTATSTKYDSYFWSGITSAIIYTDADTCYYMKNGSLCKRVNDTETVVSDSAADVWYVWGGEPAYWTGHYNYLAIKNNILYYNSNDKVYAYDIKTGTETVHYEYKKGNGYIYGLAEALDGTVIKAEIKTHPNYSTVEMISITPIPPAIQYGDCNKDGEIGVSDAVEVKKYLAKAEADIDIAASDVNADGVVSVSDAVKLMMYLAKVDVVLGEAD